MKRRTVLATTAVSLTTAVAGCSSDGPDTEDDPVNPVELADNTAGERSSQSLRLTIGDDLTGTEWQSVGATYPRDQFRVQSAQHEDIGLGANTSGDGNADREFDAGVISGVNNNDFSFTVEVDTDYTLAEGDTVVVEYPAVDNPSEPGDYEVETSVNEVQTATTTVTIG